VVIPSAIPALLLALAPARASEPYSLDIELLRPGSGWGGVPGVAYPHELQPGGLRLTSLALYTRDPLVLYEEGTELGAMVGQRATIQLGAGFDFERAQLGLALPLVVQDGGDLSELSAEGFGLGDPCFGLALPLLRGPYGLAATGTVYLPFGRQAAYLGEPSPRAELGAAYRLRSGRFELVGDAALRVRQGFESDERLEVGSELLWGDVVRVDLRQDRATLLVGLVNRHGLGARWDKPQNAVTEAITGAQLRGDHLQLDLGVGRAVLDGYGGPQLRAWLGLSHIGRPQRDPEPLFEPIPVELEAVREAVVERAEEAERLAWKPRELARITREEIEIREPIQFHFDTDEVLPVSLPTLEAVAALLRDNPHLLLVAVEGHASEEGSFRYNYDLSNRRAHAVLRELVRAGVHPSRLTVRGMGEVVPVVLGTDEASLALNRRVVFHIVQRVDPLDPIPEPARSVVPWSGEPISGEEPQP
jgi:outer membrane protein OmpA-like peptidoglycan-associated protein